MEILTNDIFIRKFLNNFDLHLSGVVAPAITVWNGVGLYHLSSSTVR